MNGSHPAGRPAARARLARALCAILAVAATLFAAPPPARAATTLYVHPAGDDANDCLDAAPARACRTIGAAVAKAPSLATIRVAAGTYRENLQLTKSVTIVGESREGTTIDGGGAGRVVETQGQGAGVQITLLNLTLQNGSAEQGGGLRNGAATTLQVRDSAIVGNSASVGGGIYNDGTLRVQRTIITGNQAAEQGGGIFNARSKSLEIFDGAITDNVSGGDGGGVATEGAVLLRSFIERATISGNRANGRGGGVTLTPSASFNAEECSVLDNQAEVGGGISVRGAASLILVDCHIADNQAIGGAGGGLHSEGATTILNSTISGNRAVAPNGDVDPLRRGGGIHNTGVLRLSNATVSGNQADTGGGIYNAGTMNPVRNATISFNSARLAGGVFNGAGTFVIQNSILAANLASAARPDCDGEVRSRGYNLLGINAALAGGGRCLAAPGAGDLVGDEGAAVDPRLDPLLRDNGGHTPTHAPLEDSPAIDAGNPEEGTGLACLAADQRGVERPVDGDGDGVARCDIGAVEHESAGIVPRLALTKQASARAARPGEEVTFTLTISATAAPQAAALTDTLPAGLTLSEGPSGGATYDQAARQIRFSGTATPETPVTITYRATVDAGVAPGTILNNTAELTGPRGTIRRSAPVAVPVEPEAFSGTLVLLYANGDHDPRRPTSIASEVLELINRAERGAANEQIVVLALLDGPGADDHRLFRLHRLGPGEEPCITYTLRSCGDRYREGVNVWSGQREDMGSPDTLRAFVTGAVSAYAGASKVVLSLVGHGGGWSPEVLASQPSGHRTLDDDDDLGGLLWDDSSGNSLSTPDLGAALRASVSETGRQIDLLYLDACSMATVEVAYEVRDSVGFLLASESVKWSVFPYDAHLRGIDDAQTVADIGRLWLETEARILRAEGGARAPESFTYPFTYSLTDLAQMPALAKALGDLGEALAEALPDQFEPIADAFAVADCFDSNQDGRIVRQGEPPDGHDHSCDIGSFAYELEQRFPEGSEVRAAARDLQAILERAIVAEDHEGGTWKREAWRWQRPAGLTIFTPLSSDNWRRAFYDKLALSRDDGRWGAFLAAWWGNLAPPPRGPCAEPCQLPPKPEPLGALRLRVVPHFGWNELAWNAAPGGAARYRILRGEAQPAEIATVDGLSYIDAAGGAGGRACYTVQALGQRGEPLTSSQQVCARFQSVGLQVPTAAGAPGATGSVFVQTAGAGGLSVGEATVVLTFDPDVIEPLAVYPAGLPAVAADTSRRGEITVSARGGASLFSDGSLFRIEVRVLGEPGETSLLALDQARTAIRAAGAQAGPVPLRLQAGTFTVGARGALGDLNADAAVDDADAGLALAYAAGRLTPDVWQQLAGDANGDGAVGAADAAMIAFRAANGRWPRRDDVGAPGAGAAGAAPAAGEAVRVRLDPIIGAPGGTATAAVRLSQVADLAGAELTLTYDPAQIVGVEAVAPGELAASFSVDYSASADGVLRIALAGARPVSGSGALLTITFRLAPTLAGATGGQVTLAQAALSDLAGRDFARSDRQQTVAREHARVTTGVVLYLPVIGTP